MESLSLQASASVFESSTNSLFNELEMSESYMPHSMSTDSLNHSGEGEDGPTAYAVSFISASFLFTTCCHLIGRNGIGNLNFSYVLYTYVGYKLMIYTDGEN